MQNCQICLLQNLLQYWHPPFATVVVEEIDESENNREENEGKNMQAKEKLDVEG